MAKDLLYRPQIGYEKNYYTEGKLYDFHDDDDSNSESLNNSSNDKVSNLKDYINKITDKLQVIPNEILDTFLPPFFIINDLINQMIKDKENIPSINIEDDIDTIVVQRPSETFPETDYGDIPDDPFSREEDVYVDIKVNTVPEDVLLEVEYNNDLIDVIEEYLINYNKSLDEYINNTVINLSYSNNKSLLNITTGELKNKDLSHISDYLTKSKITLKQHLLLYKKLFDTDETIFHIRAVKIANEQRKRYSMNKRLEDKNVLTKGANDLLKESKLIAQKKYEENFYSLYKYLNSSVILFNESMSVITKQKKMLILLNNEEREK